MKSFKFRMQTALDHRGRQESIAKMSLAEAEAALQRGEKFLTELTEIRSALMTELCGRRDGGFDLTETRLYQEYLQIIAQSIREQEEYVRDLTITREAQKLNLLGVAQNKQALEVVKDKAKQAHLQHWRQVEQGEMDEIATARYNYQQRVKE